MSELRELTIIVPVYNNLFFTQMCIGLIQNTIRSDGPYYEVFVIDNGSTEQGMQEYLQWINETTIGKHECGIIHVIKNEKNVGVAKAWNQGIGLSEGEYVAIINNDIVFADGIFERMAQTMKDNPNVWCLSPTYTHHDMSEKWHIMQKKQRGDDGKLVNGAVGFFYMLSREAINALREDGGSVIDEQFEMLWYEDTDLFERLKKMGHTPKTITNELIHHFESKTIDLIERPGLYKNANRERFKAKYQKNENTHNE